MCTNAATVVACAAFRPEDSFLDQDNQPHHVQQAELRGTVETGVVASVADVVADAEVGCIPWCSRC